MAGNDGIDRTSVRVCGRYALHGTPRYLARPALLPVMCTPSGCAGVQGGTDAGVMHTTRIGVRTGGVSVPCRYIHTPVEMADLKDAQDCVKLLTAFVQSKLESL